GWRTFLRARASNNRMTAVDELEGWLADGYAAAYRTAWLILRDAADAEEAVQEAYLRAWRFRDAVRDADVRPWLYRVLVNACCSKLRGELARGRRHGDAAARRPGGRARRRARTRARQGAFVPPSLVGGRGRRGGRGCRHRGVGRDRSARVAWTQRTPDAGEWRGKCQRRARR